MLDHLQQRDGGEGLPVARQEGRGIVLDHVMARLARTVDLTGIHIHTEGGYAAVAEEGEQFSCPATDVQHATAFRGGAGKQRPVGLVLLVQDGAGIATHFAEVTVEGALSRRFIQCSNRLAKTCLRGLQPARGWAVKGEGRWLIEHQGA